MASRIQGITVEIGGDTTKLSKALESVNKSIKGTQSGLKDVNKLLKLDPSNTELVVQKQKMLKDAIEATKEKLATLKTAAQQANEQLANGEITQQQYDALQREIVETEQNLRSLQDQAATTNATLAKIDEAGEKLQNIGSSVENVGKKFLPVTAAVTGLGTAAVKTAADFDSEMSKVSAISGATGDDFDQLRAKAREMGAKTKFSASEAASAMEYDYEQIAMILTQKKRSTLRGRQEWNGMMVANIMKNERRWGDLEARKSIVVDYKLGKVTKNNGNRCSAYVPEHHEAIVSPEIARAAHLVASSSKKCGVQDIVVIRQGALKGFVGIHPNWSGINAESIRSLCLNAYLPEEVVELNDMTEMRSGKKADMALLSDYLTVSGTCFINQSSPVITISKNGIRFSKACHTRLDDCEYVELLYHPILQVVILRKSNRDASTAIHWENKDKICNSFSSRAFSGVIFEAMNWKWSCRYQCRGICRGEENAKFLIFELDESRILIRKNQYEQIEDRSMNLKCRLYRSKWVQSIAASDVMESGQVVENPMIGAIPSRNEVQRELDDLLMSM